jgi:DNA-binding Lrp family transcriptional regulator
MIGKMDQIDVRICQMLALNARVPYRDLADQLSISVQAVHRRVQNLIDDGTIHRLFTIPSDSVIPHHHVYVYGKTELKAVDKIADELGEDPRVMGVYSGSNSTLYVAGYIEDMTELDAFAHFAKTLGQIPTPEIGVMPKHMQYTSLIKKPEAPVRELDLLDMRIIRSMHSDPRKPNAEIAKELNASTKTVTRRLDKMVEDKLVEFSMFLWPKQSGNIVSFIHLDLKDGTDKNKASMELMGKYGARIPFLLPFINIPNRLVGITWSRSTLELDELERSLETEEMVENLENHLLYRIKYFETWRDTRIDEMIEEIEK